MEAGVSNIIFSTLPSVRNITDGRLINVVHFNVKYDIGQYIRQLPIASSFIALGAFMSNFATFLRPQDVGDGTFAVRLSMPSSTLLPLVDPADVGHAVVQVSQNFEIYSGKTINLAAELKTLDEIAAVIARVNARTVKYVQIPLEAFLAPLSKHQAEDWAEFGLYMSDFGYFGEETTNCVTEEFGRLTMFEEFVREHVIV